ncbi:hypothetical protein [Dysgonomonas gadei]|uniref:Uncharacterized protein n=1 Tax=Dysgonomonas gadei ATCC BAA-286 TaxID=742766 RepID=F5ITI4_9BACT|nr:hypothetical protein [Dysgonomonas gadei]EGJ99368.1 hypothetical protein HMPREF9455_00401 [Dysgonomonas gadei ATCC BAA-286]
MNKVSYLILLFLLSLCSAHAQDKLNKLDYGLFIKSHPESDSQKTAFILENGSSLKLGKEFTMSFEMYIRPEYLFGIVFRIITDKKENIDLMITVSDDDKRYPLLAINEVACTVSQEIIREQWVPVSITLSREHKEITLSYGLATLTKPYDLSSSSDVYISYGICPVENFGITDIASVNIRDIKIFHNGALTRYWKLKEHNQNISLDSISQVPAIATNPKWIIDDYSSWKKIYSKKIKDNSQFTFDQDHLFYIVSPDSKNISVFDSKSGGETEIMSKSGYMVANVANMIYFDTIRNNIVTYNLDEDITSTFSFETNSWSYPSKPVKEPGYMNNTAVYLANESTLYSFGGYGFYKYNHDLVKMNTDGGSMKKFQLSEISPRFSASSAIVDNQMYIFGGRGSKSGRQELSPRNYYDFYSVNLIMGQANKLWEEENIDGDFMPGENMVYDKDRDCFYLFTTKDGGTLFKISPDKKGFEQISYPIHEDLEAFFLYTNLYYSASQQKLFALFYRKVSDTESLLSIYSLDFPPVYIADLQQAVVKQSDSEDDYLLPIVISILSVAIICAVFALLVKIRSKKQENTIYKRFTTTDNVQEKRSDVERIPDELVIQKQNHYNFEKQSVCLIGGFTVKDNKGNDITGMFTPTLKYLLVLLILYTQKDARGISGKKIIQLLWFDKDEVSAKKNRNVYFSKLRSIFESVGGVEIGSQNGFWSIKFGKSITCDYFEAMQLFSTIKESQFDDRDSINRLLELLLRGVLLPNTETDWTDNFKSDFSNLTIDVLTDILQSGKYQPDDNMKLNIADTILLHDFINEEALYLKCSILFNSGKKGIAKSIYDNFCKEYFNLLGVQYKYSLTDVIEKKF